MWSPSRPANRPDEAPAPDGRRQEQRDIGTALPAEVRSELTTMITAEGVPLGEVVAEMTRAGVPPSITSRALTELILDGEAELTSDRLLRSLG